MLAWRSYKLRLSAFVSCVAEEERDYKKLRQPLWRAACHSKDSPFLVRVYSEGVGNLLGRVVINQTFTLLIHMLLTIT